LSAFKNKSSFIYRFLHGNFKEALDRMLDEFVREGNAHKRNKLMDDVEDYIQKEHIFLFNDHALKKRSFSPLLEGVSLHHFGWADFRQIWSKPCTV
jgi:MarR-like DNA-binding transcriptional regulator SgrR of sgrS sRNA